MAPSHSEVWIWIAGIGMSVGLGIFTSWLLYLHKRISAADEMRAQIRICLGKIGTDVTAVKANHVSMMAMIQRIEQRMEKWLEGGYVHRGDGS